MSSKIKKGKVAQELNSSKDNSDLKTGNSTKKARLTESLKNKWKENNAWPVH